MRQSLLRFISLRVVSKAEEGGLFCKKQLGEMHYVTQEGCM